MVVYGFSETVRLVAELGAHPFVIELPRVRGADGRWRKIAIDDFIVEYGAEEFLDLIVSCRKLPAHIPLNQYREQLAKSRAASIGNPGVYLDRSPTGSGKSYADIEAMRQAGKSLTILYSHKNCRESEKTFNDAGLTADAYPKLDAETCLNLEEAEQAMNAGLAPTASVCRKCSQKDECDYQFSLKLAQKSPHSIATMHRASLSFRELSEGRPYITVHEDPAGFLRPNYEVKDGFEKVVAVARQAYDDANLRLFDRASMAFFRKLEMTANWLSAAVNDATNTATLPCPEPEANPNHCDLRLWEAMKHINVWPDGDVMRICKAVASGYVKEVTVRVDKVYERDGTIKSTRKAILAVFKTDLPPESVVWIADATATAAEITALVGRPVIDATPDGTLARLQPIYQLAADITQHTASSVIVRHIRAVLAAFPEARRVGVITHKKHTHVIEGTARKGHVLDEESRRRIVKVDYFRSGGSRGSNLWLEECDLLIVAGTPRPNPAAIEKRLIQLGMTDAAAHGPKQTKWGPDWWSGRTLDGKVVTIKTLGYGDWDWRDAYEAVVGAELVQAVGRARSVCGNGVPAVVISTHKIGKQGYPLLDANKCRVEGKSERSLLDKLTDIFAIGLGEKSGQANGHSSYSNTIREMSVSTAEIATAFGKTSRQTLRLLEGLESAGHVERVGKRGGWRITERQAAILANGVGAGAGG
jgi:hypothetical protein